jgi:hypothetical protein
MLAALALQLQHNLGGVGLKITTFVIPNCALNRLYI